MRRPQTFDEIPVQLTKYHSGFEVQTNWMILPKFLCPPSEIWTLLNILFRYVHCTIIFLKFLKVQKVNQNVRSVCGTFVYFWTFFKTRERKTNVTLIITWLAPQYESSHEHQFLVDKHAILCKLALIDSVNTKGLPKQCRLQACWKRGGTVLCMGFYSDIFRESRCCSEIKVWGHLCQFFVVFEVPAQPLVNGMSGNS